MARHLGRDLHAQVPGLPAALLPVGPEEALAAEDTALPHPVPHRLPRAVLVCRGRPQLASRGHARRGTERDRPVPNVLQVATDAHPVVGRGRKVAAAFFVQVADHRLRRGVQQTGCGADRPFVLVQGAVTLFSTAE